MAEVRAVDVLYHPSRATCPPDPAVALQSMDQAGVSRALISQCKQWSCERQWMCIDTRLEDVLRFTTQSPRFVGVAGYNPFDIAESLREIDAAAGLGFRGVYLHVASFDLRLADARLYPFFAKAAELRIPALVQLGIAEPALTRTVARICSDFTELSRLIVPARPDPVEMEALAGACENLGFVLDPPGVSHLLRRNPDFFNLDLIADRCCWGTNGVPFVDALSVVYAPPVSLEFRQRFLFQNAERLFRLDLPAQPRTPESLPRELVTAER